MTLKPCEHNYICKHKHKHKNKLISNEHCHLSMLNEINIRIRAKEYLHLIKEISHAIPAVKCLKQKKKEKNTFKSQLLAFLFWRRYDLNWSIIHRPCKDEN